MDAEQLGQHLRAAREARELTLAEVEQALRIRAKYLAAFEEGVYDPLPGVVQARGFLSNYARFLALDVDAVLAEYDAILSSSPTRPAWRRRAAPTRRAAPVVVEPDLPDVAFGVPTDYTLADQRRFGRGRRVWLVLGVLLGVVALAGLCLGGAQLIEQVLTSNAGQEGPNLLEILPTVPSVTPSATFLPSSTPLPGQQVAALGPPITDRVVVSMEVVQRTWVRVTADGEVQYEGLLAPGATLQYQAAQMLNVQASNGAGLSVIFNNILIGPLGRRGEAVDTTFTPELALTPTQPILPTPTFTPPPLPGIPAAAGEAGSPDLSASTATVVSPAGDLTAEPSPVAPPLAQTDTPAPTATVTPSLTRTPTATAILPPRLTITPSPQKPGS